VSGKKCKRIGRTEGDAEGMWGVKKVSKKRKFRPVCGIKKNGKGRNKKKKENCQQRQRNIND